jgi:TonB family protein
MNRMRMASSLALTAGAVTAPAAARDWPTTAGWEIVEDDPFACRMAQTNPAAQSLVLRLNGKGEVRVWLRGVSMPHTLRVSGRLYSGDEGRRDAATSAGLLSDLAAAPAADVLDSTGNQVASVDLTGSTAALAELRRCAEELERTVETQFASGAIQFDESGAESSPLPAEAQRFGQSLASYVSVDDYPLSALLSGIEGVVGFRLYIDASGRVSRCAVSRSSGSPALDVKTCQIFLERARFTPARDAQGRATTDMLASRIVWRMQRDDDAAEVLAPPAPPPLPPTPPRAGPAPALPKAPLRSLITRDDYPVSALLAGEQGTVAFQLEVRPDGRVGGCAVTKSSGSAALDATTCRLMRMRARFSPALGADNTPRPDRLAATILWAMEPDDEAAETPAPEASGAPPPAPPQAGTGSPAVLQGSFASLVTPTDYPAAARRNGEQGTVGFRLTVDSDGRVSDCVVTKSSGSSALDAATCRIAAARARFRPARDRDGKAVRDYIPAHIRWALPGAASTPHASER